MQYTATAKNVKMSPRKMRLVANAVKKQVVPVALISLGAMSGKAAEPIKKVIESAMANAVHNFKKEKGDLSIAEILVNEGVTYKRFHFAGRGRTRPYKKRTSHITVILADKLEQEQNLKLETKVDEKSIEKIEKTVKTKEVKTRKGDK